MADRPPEAGEGGPVPGRLAEGGPEEGSPEGSTAVESAAVESAAVESAAVPDLTAVADGLDVLIRFHDREIDTELLEGLAEHDVVAGLAELIGSEPGHAAVAELGGALTALGPTPGDDALDALATDYADLYLTHGFRVAPSGSVWLTEDRLERQLPMFEVRDWYEHYAITVPNWRVRADDHLVHELQFVAHLLRLGGPVAADDAARFLDLHVLSWVPEFCARAAVRVREPVYAGVMVLTAAYLDALRDLLEEVTGRAREVRQTVALETERQPEPDPAAYVPGTAESW